MGGRGSCARFDMCVGSLSSLSEQFGQADEVIGGHCEGELPIDLEQAAMPHLAQAGHCLGPAEGLLDAFADALRAGIAGRITRAVLFSGWPRLPARCRRPRNARSTATP